DTGATTSPAARRKPLWNLPAAPMTFDLGPWLGTVPDAAVHALAGPREVLIVSHENPDADTLGAALGVAAIVERGGARATLVSTDPVPALYDFLAGMDRFRTDPE